MTSSGTNGGRNGSRSLILSSRVLVKGSTNPGSARDAGVRRSPWKNHDRQAPRHNKNDSSFNSGESSSNNNKNDKNENNRGNDDENSDDVRFGRILFSDVGLSFWGGIDPVSGIVVDASASKIYNCDVSNSILCLPSGRGSCTASQVLLELILNNKSPAAIVLRNVDGLLSVGALVAELLASLKQEPEQSSSCESNKKSISIPHIVCVGEEGWNQLQERVSADNKNNNISNNNTNEGSFSHLYGGVISNGTCVFGESMEEVQHAITDVKGGEIVTRVASNVMSNETAPLLLTREEQDLLSGTTTCANATVAEKMAMRVVCQYANIVGATRLMDITKAHIDGCTYIGPGGLEFVQQLVAHGGSVKVPTTLNSVSSDRRRWKALGVPHEYAQNSRALGDAYLQLGCDASSFTCAPYLLPHVTPQLGEDIIWGESNAVVFANSVLGARTEKYADYLDICCALVKKVPASGVHLEENRQPQVIIDATDAIQQNTMQSSKDDNVDELLDDDSLFAVLGHLCGSKADGRLPVVLGFESIATRITQDHLKSFCAAYGTTGTTPLIHVAGVTPEMLDPNKIDRVKQNSNNLSVKVISLEDLQDRYIELDGAGGNGSISDNSAAKKESSSHGIDVIGEDEDKDRIDLVALGNPHLSLTECERLAALTAPNSHVDNSSSASGRINNNTKTKHPNVRVMATLSRHVFEQASQMGFIKPMERFGIEFINDTCWCMLLDPPVIPPAKDAVIMTNSGKYAHYGPGLTNRKFRFGSMADCIAAATTGRYPSNHHQQQQQHYKNNNEKHNRSKMFLHQYTFAGTSKRTFASWKQQQYQYEYRRSLSSTSRNIGVSGTADIMVIIGSRRGDRLYQRQQGIICKTAFQLVRHSLRR